MFFTLILPVAAFLSVPFSISSFFKLPASFRGERKPPPHAVARSGATSVPFFGSGTKPGSEQEQVDEAERRGAPRQIATRRLAEPHNEVLIKNTDPGLSRRRGRRGDGEKLNVPLPQG